MGVKMMKDCREDDFQKAFMQRNDHRRMRKEKKMARLARKAAREGRESQKNGDFTNKMCDILKKDMEKNEAKKELRELKMIKQNPELAGKKPEAGQNCPCDKKTWRGRKYIGKVSSIDGRVTSSTSDGRMWTIVSKGEGGVDNG